MKRRKLRSGATAPASVSEDSTAPPPVLNLSTSKVLTEGHFGIFKRGPKFVPTPFKADFAEFKDDFELWKNKLRWAYHHENKPEPSDADNNTVQDGSLQQSHATLAEKDLIKSQKSRFTAPVNKNFALELFLHKLDVEIKNTKEKSALGDNLSKEERKALNEMKSWTDVVIRPYDKGVGFVVDDTESYKSRIMSEIQSPNTYRNEENPEQAIVKINDRIKGWTSKYPQDLSPALVKWLVDTEAGFGYVYMNYKAHKPEKQYPGRYITSGCGSPTERLSMWIEHYLKPLMDTLPCRLQDTPHFLRKLDQYNSSSEEGISSVILCSWDIEAMFPNIDNELGLTACKDILNKRPIQEPSTESIVEAIQITLEENIAEFDQHVVKQCSGTAMGPHHACSYTDIAVDKAIDKRVNDPHENPWKHCIALWGRFRDDIFCIWTGSEEELQDFNLWLNNLESKLKFTIEFSRESVVFLDLRLTVKGSKVESSMYSKPSDSHAYLLPTSCHPAHICKNIPQGVMKRVRRNCSEEGTRLETYQEYKQYLLQRDYSLDLIEEAIKLAEDTPRAKLLGTLESLDSSSKSRKFPLIMKFNPRLPPMSKYISQHMHILELTPETNKIFSKDSVFVSYKTEQNILSMITKNRFKCRSQSSRAQQVSDVGEQSNIVTDAGCYGCVKKCTLCKDFLIECRQFTSSKTNQTFNIKSKITCDTKNVIYMITDKICTDVFYVGYTQDNMKTRWANHKSHIKACKKTCELASHFIKLANTTHKLDKSNQKVFTSQLSRHLEIRLIESVAPIQGVDMKEHMESREKFWQGTLKAARLYGGLNKR